MAKRKNMTDVEFAKSPAALPNLWNAVGPSHATLPFMYRSAKRVPVHSPFLLDGEMVGSCRDVSIRGAFVESPARPALGTQHRCEMTLDGLEFRCTATVVRHTGNGFAVEFEDAAAKLDRELQDLLGPDVGEDDLRFA